MKNTLFYLFFLIFSVQLNGMDDKGLKPYCSEKHNEQIIQKIINSLQNYDGKDVKMKKTIQDYSHVNKIREYNFENEQSLLDRAILYNNKHSVKLLLLETNGEAAEYLTYSGSYSALKNADIEIADLLFGYSIIKEKKDALLRSAVIGDASKDIAKRAIEHGADVNAKIQGVPFIISTLFSNNMKIIEIAELLIASDRIDVNCCAPDTGNTPLLIAIWKNDPDMVQLLCNKKGINLAQKNNTGWGTPLHFALSVVSKLDSKEKILKILCQYNAIGINDLYNGRTPLYRAVFNCEINPVLILLTHKFINIDQQNENGQTALHEASVNALKYKCGKEILIALLERNANVNIIDTDGRTPLDEVNRTSYSSNIKQPIVDLLKEYGAKTYKELCDSKISGEIHEIVDQEIQEDNQIEQPQFFITQKSLLIGGIGFILFLLLYCGYKYNWHVLLHKNFV